MRAREQFLRTLRDGLRDAGVDPGQPLVVAVSGGPDSMALLQGLVDLGAGGPPLIAAHFNHRLRGPASEADARFVADWCREAGVGCVIATGDVAEHRRATGLSPEAAARSLRYGFLRHVVGGKRAQAVATAHTMDDQAETVLLHAVRGSGLRGAQGMRPRSTMRPAEDVGPATTVVRPLLKARRSDTVGFCRESGIRPRIDHSNEDAAVPRNRIRLHVLPELEKINPEAVPALARLADAVALDLSWIDREVAAEWDRSATESAGGGVLLDRTRLAACDPALRRHLLRAAYRNVAGAIENLSLANVEQMIELASGSAGTRLDLPGDARMRVEADRVILAPAGGDDIGGDCPFPEMARPAALTVPGVTQIGPGREIRVSRQGAPDDPTAHGKWIACLDAGSVGNTLAVRSRRAGDRFQPLGMGRPKKLQDFLVDEHVPRAWRDRIPLVEAPAGIAWVVGYRPAEWAKVTSGTGAVLRLEYRRTG